MRAPLDLKEVSYQMGDQEDEKAQPKVKTEGVSIKDAVKRAEAMKVDHRPNDSAIAKREANQARTRSHARTHTRTYAGIGVR